MFDAQDAPQPPKVLTTPLEIASNLRMLQESHDPLIITFQDRTQRFQSYVVDVNRESKLDRLTTCGVNPLAGLCWSSWAK